MEQRLVFFDLETGGADPKRHPIIQLAAVAIESQSTVLEAFEAKIRFDSKKANSHSLRKNHYHPGRWATEARSEKDVAREFAAFLRRHATVPALSVEGKGYHVAQLAAHNASFDAAFLTAWFDRMNLYLPARRLVLCTMQLAMWQFAAGEKNPPANYKLSTLCEYFRVPFHAATAHDALGDATATVQLFHALIRHSRTSLDAAA